MKLRVPREPFFGTTEFDGVLLRAEDLDPTAFWGDDEAPAPVQPDGHDPWSMEVPEDAPAVHPDAVEKGIELPLGFIPHRGENRTQRRAAVANFSAEGADRRELWAQRQRQRRGKLDPELRRLQRRKAETK